MGKIRILQFPIANSKGGLTQYVLNNWRWMDKEKFQCDFITMSTHLDFESEILETGSRVYHISCYAENNREQFIKEFEEILSQEYNVVHLHTKQWKSFLVEELCKKYNIPKVIVHSHNAGIDLDDPIERNKEKELHERIKKLFNENMATDFWACSKLAADFLFGEQIDRKKIRIMPNAIDLDKFAFDMKIRFMYRKEYALTDSFVIGHVGRYEYQKNHEFLINMFLDFLEKVENAKLILIGDGKLFYEIQEKARCLDIDDKILFLGKRSDVSNWYQVMDVFCLPSRFEGLPISMIEAQASGLPCIGSNHITREVKIGDSVYFLPLDKDLWINKLMEIKGIKRQINKEKLIDQGYDIKIQIKNIEQEYACGTQCKKDT